MGASLLVCTSSRQPLRPWIQLWLSGPHSSLPTLVTSLHSLHLSSPLRTLASKLLRPPSPSRRPSTTTMPVTPQPETSSASGSSSPWSSSSPGLSVSPSPDTSRALSSGKDTRPWRPSVKPSQLLRDTSTSPLVASLASAPGSPASPSVTLLTSSSTSSTNTRARPPTHQAATTLARRKPPPSTTWPSTS